MAQSTTDLKPRFYFAFRSPYSRIALSRVKPFADQMQFVPFLGPPKGNTFSDPMQISAKRAYYQQDVLRMSMRNGLPLALPQPFDVDFMPANQAFLHADQLGLGFELAHALSEARWGRGLNISEPDVLKVAAMEAGLTDDGVEKALANQKDLSPIHALIEQDQAFGVPFVVAGDQKYWGQDRLDILFEDMGWE